MTAMVRTWKLALASSTRPDASGCNPRTNGA
jgi:hypothetical protein